MGKIKIKDHCTRLQEIVKQFEKYRKEIKDIKLIYYGNIAPRAAGNILIYRNVNMILASAEGNVEAAEDNIQSAVDDIESLEY